MYKIIDGKEVSKKIKMQLKEECTKLKENGIIPKLAVIMCGNNEASKVYVRNKSRACEEVGIEYVEYFLDEDITQEELNLKIEELNKDNSISGVLLQSPIPNNLDINEAFKKISFK